MLEAEHVAEPGHVAGAAARLGLALDPLELVGEGDSEGHVASLAAAAAISVRAVLSRYRWLVLAAGTAAQTSFSAVIIGLPVLAPDLRDEHSLSLLQVGVVLDSLWIGTLVTLLPWGLLADRRGERLVLGTGLSPLRRRSRRRAGMQTGSGR